ncbi:MAG: DUF3667 domain-containing protein [Chitinophagaceae bacterium]
MSHLPERKERNCLNCGTIVQGRYCQVCGQENTEPKESFWHMITHFLSDITHFDGKFFSTIKVLFRKPGQLTKEYLAGRRVAYLHPVRMYVFTSAFFFLIFFTFFKLDNSDASVPTINGKIAKDFADEAYKNAKTREDSIIIATSLGFLSIKPGDTAVNSKEDNNDIRIQIDDNAKNYESVREYDSVQKALPPSERHNLFRRILIRKNIELNVKYKGREDQLSHDLIEKFLHILPYLLFVSLPLYALFLKLLYVRRRKQFYYVDHGLFLIHLYIFTFLLLLIFFILLKLKDNTGWGWIGYFQLPVALYGVIYTLLSMKNFYRQGWGKTIFKFILFNLLCLICLVLLFVIFMVLTVYQV